MSKEPAPAHSLFAEIKTLIDDGRRNVAVTVNAAMTMLYWQIGKRVNEEVTGDRQAEYGKRIVSTLSKQLVQEYGNSFSEKNLRRMMQFAEAFPSREIVVSLIRQLSWTHVATQGATGAGLLRANVQPGTLECAHVARARELDAV